MALICIILSILYFFFADGMSAVRDTCKGDQSPPSLVEDEAETSKGLKENLKDNNGKATTNDLKNRDSDDLKANLIA